MLKQEQIIQIIHAAKTQINTQEKKPLIIKTLLVVAVFVFLVLNSLHDFVSPDYVPDCIRDEMHELTLPINEYLNQNQFYRNLLIIFASTMMDINVFVLAIRWILYEKSYKTIYVIVTFYLFRAFMQSVFFLKFPTNYIWGHPGLFSITVPYNPANDFFYSGHLGLCTICYIHFSREGLKFMKFFGVATIVIEFFTLLITRAHYFIDLVTGMIVAHYFFIIADWIQDYFQNREMEKQAKSREPNSYSTMPDESQTKNNRKKTART